MTNDTTKPATAEKRSWLTEDWAATILGLVLLGLTLLGAINADWLP